MVTNGGSSGVTFFKLISFQHVTTA